MHRSNFTKVERNVLFCLFRGIFQTHGWLLPPFLVDDVPGDFFSSLSKYVIERNFDSQLPENVSQQMKRKNGPPKWLQTRHGLYHVQR